MKYVRWAVRSFLVITIGFHIIQLFDWSYGLEIIGWEVIGWGIIGWEVICWEVIGWEISDSLFSLTIDDISGDVDFFGGDDTDD